MAEAGPQDDDGPGVAVWRIGSAGFWEPEWGKVLRVMEDGKFPSGVSIQLAGVLLILLFFFLLQGGHSHFRNVLIRPLPVFPKLQAEGVTGTDAVA